MAKQAHKHLLRAVLEPRKKGAIQQIAEACAAGADPNGICPESSITSGYVRGGSTLLTHAIHEGASRVVEKLLECGANPDLTDGNGWTPWMASTLVDESKRTRIQELLSHYGASKDGEHIGQLARALIDGDVVHAVSLITSKQDLRILTSFRVDLVRHQILNGNTPMLKLLLEHKMQPDSAHLISAIKARYLPGVDLLLSHGLAPESPDEEETPLMMAAGMGELNIVQCLVKAGADVNRCAYDNIEWTAAFYAKEAGYDQIADWLISYMDKAVLEKQQQIMVARNPRFRLLYKHATASEALSTDDIVAILEQWNDQYGIDVRNASTDSITIEFSSLPEDIESFFEEVLSLCPDASEDRRTVQSELLEKKVLSLWWD